jgi:uncharacterized circularly permuted ATP-grasp superfamily protein
MGHPDAHPHWPALLADYAPQPGVSDELLDASGAMRPVWEPFIRQLAALPEEDVLRRFARGEQYLRDTGVYFRLYSGGPATDREWPLSHVPVLLADDDWQGICAGLTQRAELLERVMADLYGPAQLVADGHLPAELVAENPQWLRPMVGVTPRSGHWLHHLAFEIGRSPDGSFFVLGDRAQAPSGSGFALENRMATTRIFADPFPRANVRRLAGFFRDFRATMERLSGDGRRMAILTPGPNNDTYFEHTYIARYLGMTLLEGEDLIVQNGQVMVRTVQGLQPLGLLWRRIDSEFCDPLELNEGSQIGTPGLIGALRDGGVTLINAPGSGILETRALMAFLPRICETLFGEPLQMPNIATWWCGQPLNAPMCRTMRDRMMIGGALDTSLPFAIGADTALGGKFRGDMSGTSGRLDRGQRAAAGRARSGHPVHNTRLGGWPPAATPDDHPRFRRTHGKWLDIHAGRVCADRAQRRCHRACHADRRVRGRCLGRGEGAGAAGIAGHDHSIRTRAAGHSACARRR